MAFLAAFILSFAPALLFAWIIYWTDRYEPEPISLIWSVFTWGSIVAAGAAFLLNTLSQPILAHYFEVPAKAIFAQRTLVAPIVEEFLKAFAVLAIFIVRTDEFDSIIDGIVYAGITAIGFAATENLFYLYQGGYQANGWDGLFAQFFFRVILGAWNHLLYTSLFGIGLAIARLSYQRIKRIFAPILGLFAAITAHAIHNALHVQAESLDVLILVILVDWAAWFVLALIIMWALRQERIWVFNEMLSEVARGTLTNRQYIEIISPRISFLAYFQSLLNGNFKEKDYLLKISTELAYKKHQLKTVGLNKGNSPEVIRKLRGDLEQAAKSN